MTKADIQLVRALADKRGRTEHGLFVAEGEKLIGELRASTLRIRRIYALDGVFAALGLPVCGTFLEGANIYETELKPAGIVVMGNEGRGITDAVARTVTQKLFIPPWPADRRGSESLNVAMATGIVCGEFRRQASAKAGK